MILNTPGGHQERPAFIDGLLELVG